jgi:hypothetical protein
MLSNQRHDAVALAYIADPERVGWRAYKKVYPKSTRRTAESNFSRLLKNAEFRGRLAELQAAAANGAEITLEGLLREAAQVQEAAIERKQFAAAISALRLKAELSGHYVQRREDVTPRRSEEEIIARLRELLADGDPKRSSDALGGASRPLNPSQFN